MQPPMSNSYDDTVADGEKFAKMFGVPFVKGSEEAYSDIQFQNHKLTASHTTSDDSKLRSRHLWSRLGWALLYNRAFQHVDRKLSLVLHPYLGAVLMGLTLTLSTLVGSHMVNALVYTVSSRVGVYNASLLLTLLFMLLVVLVFYHQYGAEYVIDLPEKRLIRNHRLLGLTVRSRTYPFDDLHGVVETMAQKNREKSGYRHRYGLSVVTNSGDELAIVPSDEKQHAEIIRDGRYLADLLEIPLYTTNSVGKLKVIKG